MLLCITSLLGSALVMGTSPPNVEYLGDLLHRFIVFQQGWGELGIDNCAHAPGQTPLPLRIGDRDYAKGLGHHAPGEIVIELNGEYAQFEAEVGVQWQQGTTGSVVFQVYVDGKKRFDSGIMRETDPPKPLRVRTEGASELRLVVTDAGDGITCDCANWANARLTRSSRPKAAVTAPRADVAPFARVVTSDPARVAGCSAGRTEEYHAEDIFLELPLTPETDGAYTVPISPRTGGSIGLHWLERRRIAELRLQFVSSPPPLESVQVQAWIGESHWQGKWASLPCSIERDGNGWVFRPAWREVPGALYGVRKVRWVFAPATEPIRIRTIRAYTTSRWEEREITFRLQSPQEALIRVYNGEIVTAEGTRYADTWDGRSPLRLKARYCRPSALKSDRTVLRIRLPEVAFGVAVDDVIEQGAVWVPDAGLLVACNPKLTIDAYQRKVASRKTVLERVREMHEQTFQQAMAKTHHKVQNNGPMLLSLACDNRKFIVERDGTLRREDVHIRPQFAGGKAQWTQRHLYGGWLPVPVITWREGDMIYRQTTFVAPLDEQPIAGSNGWLYERAACITLIEAENTGNQHANGEVSFAVQPQAEIQPLPDGYALKHGASTTMVRYGHHRWDGSVQGDTLTLRCPLSPKERCHLVLAMPAWQTGGAWDVPDGKDALVRTERYWYDVMQDATQIDIPDATLLNVIRASQVHCLLAARNEAGAQRVAAWIAAMAYGPLESEAHSVIRGMLLLGHREFARRSLDYFVHRYSPVGFLTTGYTLMGTGWHLWTLGEYVALTHDHEWLRRNAPAVNKVCRWILRQREKTVRRTSNGEPVPEYGLMPPGVMADWNAYAYYFTLNGYYYAGLQHAARALADIADPNAEEILQEAQRSAETFFTHTSAHRRRCPSSPCRTGAGCPAHHRRCTAPPQRHTSFRARTGTAAGHMTWNWAHTNWCHKASSLPTRAKRSGSSTIWRTWRFWKAAGSTTPPKRTARTGLTWAAFPRCSLSTHAIQKYTRCDWSPSRFCAPTSTCWLLY